jgi:hypothetical protein
VLLPQEATMSELQWSGRWIGESQGGDSPAHIWDITQRRGSLTIETRWEGELASARMNARLLTDGSMAGFRIETTEGVREALLIDAQHFVIAGWDTNDTRGGSGPAYDVVFSRPGVAELTAAAAYARYLALVQANRQ